MHDLPDPPAVLRALRAAGVWPRLRELPPFAEVDDDLAAQVLDEAARFVRGVVAPLNRSGDETGARFEGGRVVTPPGFRAAYQAFWQAGWPALAAAPEDGGQGLPLVLEAVLYEWLSGANHGWTMAPGLLHGAYECLRHHGSEALRERYLPRLASGEWLATMSLTEPQAGSDLGLVRTRATPLPDGRYALNGTKIFISGGEHDLTDNIVHLVLARLPDAPPGPRGLSLFLIPKFYDGGTRSAVVCERIEEKMGLHASPTCVMRFDDAPAWIVGQPGRGLAAMFVMMNAARLHVALQGLGLLDAARHKAEAYALERRQMRAPGPRISAEAADRIIDHAPVRRAIEVQRAWVACGRVLAYRTAAELDIARHHPQAQRRAAAERWCALVTPVLKAAFTDQAFHGSSACLQVFGGHGYVREWGIEQIVRDARVAMIYEGTNEIQAIDLLQRKVLADGGQAFDGLLTDLQEDLSTASPSPHEEDDHHAVDITRLTRLRALAQALLPACESDPALAARVADDFLRATAMALLGWAGAQWRGTGVADAAAAADLDLTVLQHRVLSEFDGRVALIREEMQLAARRVRDTATV